MDFTRVYFDHQHRSIHSLKGITRQHIEQMEHVVIPAFKPNEDLVSMGDCLHRYLVEHPAFIWLLGFPLVPSSQHAWGFEPPAAFQKTSAVRVRGAESNAATNT